MVLYFAVLSVIAAFQAKLDPVVPSCCTLQFAHFAEIAACSSPSALSSKCFSWHTRPSHRNNPSAFRQYYSNPQRLPHTFLHLYIFLDRNIPKEVYYKYEFDYERSR